VKKSAGLVLCLVLCASPSFAQTEDGARDPLSTPEIPGTAAPSGSSGAPGASDEQRLRIIRYGTDTEIANLIKTLRNEQADAERMGGGKTALSLDGELLTVAEKTKNRAILAGVFAYFGDREQGGLEDRALKAIENRDYEAGETVNAAVDYLGKIRAPGVKDVLVDILNGEEGRFLSGAIRALGRTAEKNGPAETVEFLVDYYANREPGDENRRLIVAALGDAGAKEGTAFLVSIAENEDERAPLRVTALESLAKIADPAGLSAVIGAVSSRDPNVRSAAVGALGPFSGSGAEDAIIEAFRDSYYRTRIAAAKAAGERKMEGAVPFLRFRAENDEVPSVRDESVKALGAIAGGGSLEILEALFRERKNGDRIRINAGEMLLARSPDQFVPAVIVEMDEAKTKNQTVLYNGFLRILGGARSSKLEDLAGRFFAAGGVVEKSYALDICANNEFRGLADEIRRLSDPKNGSLSRKSISLLEKWGLPVKAEEPAARPPDTSSAETPGEGAAPEAVPAE
jgi:HEAT repeat protein